jgi:hypothetical protein
MSERYRGERENHRLEMQRARARQRLERYGVQETSAAWRFAPSRIIADRFARNVVIDRESGCWVWTGAKDHGSNNTVLYGIFGNSKSPSPRLAHRAAYVFAIGPIPRGLTIDHLCFNALCVNPQHLEAVTLKENQRRAWERRKQEAQCPA